MGFHFRSRMRPLGVTLLLLVLPVFFAQGQSREERYLTGRTPYVPYISVDLMRLDERGTDSDSTLPPSGGAVKTAALVGAGTGLLYYLSLGWPPWVGAPLGAGVGAVSGGAVTLINRSFPMEGRHGFLVGLVLGGMLCAASHRLWGWDLELSLDFLFLMPLPGMAAGKWLARHRHVPAPPSPA